MLGWWGAHRWHGTAIIYQLAWTRLDILPAGPAVLAENKLETGVQESKMKVKASLSLLSICLCQDLC